MKSIAVITTSDSLARAINGLRVIEAEFRLGHGAICPQAGVDLLPRRNPVDLREDCRIAAFGALHQ